MPSHRTHSLSRSKRLVALFSLAFLSVVGFSQAAHAAAPDPNISVTSPSGGSTITSWAPSVTWTNAVTCSYSYDNSTFTDVNCGGTGTDIPAPPPGTVNFYLRAVNSDGIETAFWTTFTYDPPPTLGWNNQPTQASPSDTTVTVDVHVNDSLSNPVTFTVEYSLNGGVSWNDAGHLSGAAFPISGNTITGITTYGDGVNNRSNVGFYWDYTLDSSTASTTNAEIRVFASDANGSSVPLVSDPFTLRSPPAPPVFAGDSGAVTDITENSVIVHYDMSSVGSADLHHFELHYADDAYYTAHGDYAQNTPVTYTASFSNAGATNVDGLACGTTYHFVQSFTNNDNLTATSSDATFTTSDCTGGGGSGGGGTYTFTAGDGSSDNPYVIESCADLAGVNDYLGDSFVLDTNLDCSSDGNNVMIGGLGANFFSGTFDGQGHSVKVNLSLSDAGVGLFRGILFATVRNLSIAEGSQVYGDEGVGSVVGVAVDSTLSKLSSSAFVIGLSPTPTYPIAGVGGIVGGMYGGTLDGSDFAGLVGGPMAVGGIVGMAMNDLSSGAGAIISRSHSSGQVAGAVFAGGIAGYVLNGAQVRNSYSAGPVGYYDSFASGLPQTGGFGGLVGGLVDGTISRSYASGPVMGGTDSDTYQTGGLVGAVMSSDAIIVHSFATGAVAGSGAPIAGFLGGTVGVDGAFTGAYDDYFDTDGTSQSACTAEGSLTGCLGVDGSATNYWLGTSGTPLSAWDRTTVWDVSGGDGPFPVLRLVTGDMPDESDAFTGGGDTSGDSGDTAAEGTGSSSSSSHRSRGSSTVRCAAAVKSFCAKKGSLPAPVVAVASSTPATPTVTTPAGARDLQLGMSGADILALQKFLNANGAQIASSGVGSPGNETSYFGALTKAALAKFQAAHGISPAAGYFGPLTRAKMKTLGLAGLWW